MPKSPKDLLMYLPDYRASMRIGNFVKSKHTVLSTIVNNPGLPANKLESLYIPYTPEQFAGLLATATTRPSASGLRVYFATYQKQEGSPADSPNNALVPKGMEDTLTLIYSPTTNTGTLKDPVHTDTGDFYILDPTGKLVNLTGLADKGIAARWVTYYYEKKCTVLQEILNIGVDPANKVFETQNIFYEIGSIKELYGYITNDQGGWEHIPTAVYLFFGAYHLREKGQKYDFAGKLTLVMGFMDRYKNFFYYKNDDKYDQDKPDPKAVPLVTVKAPIVPTILNAGDTGVPCPPPVCPGATLGHPGI